MTSSGRFMDFLKYTSQFGQLWLYHIQSTQVSSQEFILPQYLEHGLLGHLPSELPQDESSKSGLNHSVEVVYDAAFQVESDLMFTISVSAEAP
jgi:hypothetical protein